MIMYPKLNLENAVHVELYKMTSMGHEWPSGDSIRVVDIPNTLFL